MIVGWHTLTDIAIRTSVVYLALLVGLRLTGQRQLGQMSSFDLVLLLIISNAVQNAMVGPDTSLVGGLVAAAILIACLEITCTFTRWKWIGCVSAVRFAICQTSV